jgi:prepilin-type N-terminal cleavage/methylation domain-containing protein
MRDVEAARPRRASGGFTLIEVTIALGVFAVGMLALAAMQLQAMRSGSSGRHATHAAAIAQSQMERLQRLRWTDLATTGGAFTAPVTESHTVQGTVADVEMSYEVAWRIADVQVGWTRSIDVRVSWDEPERPGRNVVLSSLRYNREGL